MSFPEATPEPKSSEAPASEPAPPEPRRGGLWLWTRRVLAVFLAVFAAVLVSLFTIDLGGIPQLKRIAEERGSEYLRRPLHIGRLSALLTPGTFVLDDVVIEGRRPEDRPFFKAGRIYVHVPWWTLFQSQLNIEMRLTEWAMVVETSRDGHNVPRLTPDPRPQPTGPRRFTTTVKYVYAQDGEFTYLDHVTPWSVVARNLSFDLVRSTALQQYVGRAHFEDGDVTILGYQPMRADMTSRFVLDGPRVQLQHIDLITDGSQSHVNGEVHFGARWPEQTYNVTSTVDFARMKQIFFAREPWRLDGEGQFTGVFKLFKGGRELAGQFESELALVNDLAFPDLHGSLIWTPERFEVTHADSSLLGGDVRFAYSIAPLGQPTGSTATFSAGYRGLDLAGLDQLIDVKGLQLDGRANGSIELQWPNGRFSAGRRGTGHTVIEPPATTVLATSELPVAPLPPRPEPAPFDPFRRVGPLVMGADLHYDFDPEGMTFRDAWVATDRTYVSFGGRMSTTGPSTFPFHVTSHDWQESDRLLAAIMTAISGPSRAIEIGGRGTFDGQMTGRFSAPRIEGHFSGENMRAWDVAWGRASADIVLEGGYVTLTNSDVRKGEGRIVPDGRYSLGFRRDDAEEIRASVTLTDWPMDDLRHAFGLDDWPVDGVVGEANLDLTGKYREMFGKGTLRIDRGTAWGEAFETATSSIELEGTGLRAFGIEMTKGGRTIYGAAHVGWNGTYAFNANGRVLVESLDNFKIESAPLSGNMTFKAEGASELDKPSYTFEAAIPDLSAGDQVIGAVEGRIRIENKRLLIERLVAREGLIDVDGSGSIALNETYDGNVHLTFTQTSVDPYLKFVMPEMSPYTQAIVSGVIDVNGPLARPAELDIATTINDAALTLFDYRLTNDGPLRIAYADQKLRLTDVRLVGSDTKLALTGGGDIGRREWNLAASGGASLAILQLFFPSITASGAATLDASLQGSFDRPVLAGSATLSDGRLRPLASPHSLENLNGQIRFGDGEITLSNLSGRIGNGIVDFGGSIALDGYRLAEYNLTANGRSMRLRYPRGFQSTVNMDLDLVGAIDAPRLTGTIDVLGIRYTGIGQSDGGLLGFAAAGVGAGTAETGQPAPISSEGIPLALDIQVSAPLMTLIRTNTASVDGSADLRVLGTFDRPLITGTIDVAGGEANLFGNRYYVSEGTIDFSSAGEPVFDVSAETRPRYGSQMFDVHVRLSGPLSAITPTLTSDPWLPQTDIATLLLGGVPSVESAEQQALRSPQELQQRMIGTVGAVLITSALSSRVGSVVERFTGIDTVQITPLLLADVTGDASLTQLNPTARVTLGKRISNRVFLTYSRTLNAQDEVILIEYDQTDQLSWVLSRNEDRTFALDFRIRYVF